MKIDDCDLFLDRKSRKLFSQKLLYWYQSNSRILPWRVKWAETGDPYFVWLSEVMLQQTLIKVVVPAFNNFVIALPSIQDVAKSSDDKIRLLTKGLGYYRRFRNFKTATELLVDGTRPIIWPRTSKEWQSLPGVGEYTGAAVASIAFDEAVPVVDGNVERILCRIFDLRIPSNEPRLKKKFKTFLTPVVDCQRPGDFNQAIMELGQLVCMPSSPQCPICPINSLCLAQKNKSQKLAPMPKIKPKPLSINVRILIPKHLEKLGLRQRTASAKFLKDSLGFETCFYDNNHLKGDGFEIKSSINDKLQPCGTFRHHIMNYNIRAEVFCYQVRSKKERDQLNWVDFESLDNHLMTNLDRKAFKVFAHHQENK